MATYGGFGGLGASYPMRYGAPKSEAIDYIGDAESWLTDWQSRYDAEEARRGQGASAGGMSKEDFIAQQIQDAAKSGQHGTWQMGKDVPALTSYFMGGQGYGYGSPSATGEVAKYALGQDRYNAIMNYVPAPPTPGYTPDFTALNAEKQKMLPMFEAQKSQQQAYSGMTGDGMLNGVIGPGYEMPDFGQISGNFGQNNPTPGQQQGVDTNWSTGAFDQSSAQAGVYAPNPYQRKQWGL